MEVDETSVPMVGSEIKVVKEVRPQDRVTDVGYNKGKIECSIRDTDLPISQAVARDFRTVGCLKFPGVGSRCALFGSRWNDRPEGSSVDQPAGSVVRVDGVEKAATARCIAGKGGVYLPALPFPGNRFSSKRGQLTSHFWARLP